MLSDDLLPGANAAAAFIGVTPRAVYHLVEAGHLPTSVRAGSSTSARASWNKPSRRPRERSWVSAGGENARGRNTD